MESKIQEIIDYAFEKNIISAGTKVKETSLIRKREDKLIWQIFFDNGKSIFVKASKPKRKNLSEIILYRTNPVYLRSFYPTVHGVIKKYGFYWVLLEALKQLQPAAISIENFKKPIELMASLHRNFYSDSPIKKDKRILWTNDFKDEWKRRMNQFRLIRHLKKYMKMAETQSILQKDKPLIIEAIRNAKNVLNPLLYAPHSLTHGCFEYHHLYAVSDNTELENLRLIDWENFAFAPVTLDLVYLIEKNADKTKKDNESELSGFRKECISYYCDVMKKHGIDISKAELEKLYNLTLLFKIVTQFIFEELEKISSGETSKYYWYKNQLSNLSDFPLGARK